VIRLLWRWLSLTIAIWFAALIIPGINVAGGTWTYFKVALLFGVINTFIGSLVKVLTFPISIISLGLFLLVINAAMLKLTDRWSDALTLNGFWSAFWGALIISISTSLLFKFPSKFAPVI